MMDEFKLHIAEKLVDEAGSEVIDVNLIEVPPDPKFGDYAFPCFTLSKELKKPPAAIAEWLRAKIKPDSIISDVKTAGPYLNFFLRRDFLAEETLREVAKRKSDYGRTNVGDGKTVVIDYSSPNVAKPFGIGHLRSTMIGNSVYRISDFVGYRPFGVNHLGDWGTQFGKLMVAFGKWGSEEELKKDPIRHLFDVYVKFHESAEADAQLEEEGRAWFKRLEQGDKKATAMWQRFRDLSMAEFKKTYARLGITFDSWNGESFYVDKTLAAIQMLKDKGLLVVSEGALVVEVGENMPPAIIVKTDGATTYLARDAAAILFRSSEYKPVKILYVTGTPQKLHFQQLFKIVELLGEKHFDLIHVDFGHFHGMSTRKGNVVFLEEVLDKANALALKIIEEKNPDLKDKEKIAEMVGTGAIIFGDLINDRIRDVEFSWERILNFEGETGPYVQYSHARICSILRKYGQPIVSDVDFKLLDGDREMALVKKLRDFREAILVAGEMYKPSAVAKYLIELCQSFNSFYDACPVLKGDTMEIVKARILLCDCTRQVLANGLYLLGISAPEEM